MSNRALLYKVLWRGYSAEIWIRPNILKEAMKGSINDQNVIISGFKKILKLGFFIKFNELRIRVSKPGFKQAQSSVTNHSVFAYAKDNISHCDDKNCDYCEFGHYSRCPNNYDALP